MRKHLRIKKSKMPVVPKKCSKKLKRFFYYDSYVKHIRDKTIDYSLDNDEVGKNLQYANSKFSNVFNTNNTKTTKLRVPFYVFWLVY
mgnify:CR=1 FL=1